MRAHSFKTSETRAGVLLGSRAAFYMWMFVRRRYQTAAAGLGGTTNTLRLLPEKRITSFRAALYRAEVT